MRIAGAFGRGFVRLLGFVERSSTELPQRISGGPLFVLQLPAELGENRLHPFLAVRADLFEDPIQLVFLSRFFHRFTVRESGTPVNIREVDFNPRFNQVTIMLRNRSACLQFFDA